MMGKKVLFILLLFMSYLYAEDNELQEHADEQTDIIYEIEDRMDQVERSTLIDRVNLSLDFRTTVNNYIYKENSEDATRHYGLIRDDGETYSLWNMRGRIKMLSRLGDSFKFTGWLTMYKQFLESAPGRYNNDQLMPFYDSAHGMYPSDSSVFMERLFLDWFILDWMAFSMGRAPTVDGAPSGLRYDNVDLATFPESLFNAPMDGAYLTFRLEDLVGLKKSYFRLIYSSRVFMDEEIPNNVIVKDDVSYMHLFMAQFDMAVPGTEGGRFIWSNGYVPGFKAGNLDIDIDGDGNKETLVEKGALGEAGYSNATIVIPQLLRTELDLFASFSYLRIVPEKRSNNDEGYIGLENADGTVVPVLSIMGNNLEGSATNGYQFYTGFRYGLPFEISKQKVRFGANVTLTSKNFWFFTAPDTTGMNIFGGRGETAETYLIIPVHRKANVRLGYIYQHLNHDWGIVFPAGGGVPEIDETIHNINAMLNIYF